MSVSTEKLPLEALIAERIADLGLTPYRLVLACGYKNSSKGLRRLRDLYDGSIDEAKQIIAGLPKALEVPDAVVTRAVEESRRMLDARAAAAEAKEEAEWRAKFVPHAIVVPENRVPQPIFVAALIGVERLRLIEFNLEQGEGSFPAQAKAGVDAKLREWGRNGVPAVGLPAFGRPIGFIVNYTPDRAVQYDLDVKLIEERSSAYRLGCASLRSGNKVIAGETCPLTRLCRVHTRTYEAVATRHSS